MPSRKPASPASSPDRATQYALDVVSGVIVAGPYVQDACVRHLDDLEHAGARGYFWDRAKAEHAMAFFPEMLCLNSGEFEGKPFELGAWQAFIVGSLFGWVDADGWRRFRVAYVETAKGSGKSPLAAGIGLLGLVADSEPRAEVYAAATKKDQAMILFRDAVAMVDQSPELRVAITKSGAPGREWNLAYEKSSGFFRPISADDGQSGPRPHVALLDEIHEHKSPLMVEMVRAGTKSRRQALIFMITNAGAGKHSVCWNYHDYAAKVCARQLGDDSFFGYVCANHEHDDPIKDESVWIKTNPSLDAGLPGRKYLIDQVTAARGMPAKESIVRRLNFCQWVEAESPWIGRDVWFAAEQEFDVDRLLGRRCFGGLDLSSTQDLTALVLHFEPCEDDPLWRELSWFWLPGDGLADKAERDRVPYDVWRDGGYLETFPGKAVNKLAVIRRLAEISGLYDLVAVAYDRWRFEDMRQQLDAEGIALPLVPFGQGFKDMSPAVDEYERRLIDAQLKHAPQPVMTWCAANAVVVSDPAGNRKVAKDKSTGRVDGVVAGVMAVGASIGEKPDSPVVLDGSYSLTVV